MATYGQKGGDGPTRGKKATTYIVTLPNGATVKKRDFNPPADPVAYAYKRDRSWHVAAIAERHDPRFAAYTPCPATAA